MKNRSAIIYQVLCLILIVFSILLLIKQKNVKKEVIMEPISKKEIVLANIHERKSVRNFIPDKMISKEDIETIVKAGMAAPSGRDARPWEIIVVDQREKLDNMADRLPYAKMLKEAPVAIIVCGDSTKSSYWEIDCSAVTENILLAVEALELGAVWTATYPYEDRMNVVVENCALPENIKPLCVIPLGYPRGENKPKVKYDSLKVHYNLFNR